MQVVYPRTLFALPNSDRISSIMFSSVVSSSISLHSMVIRRVGLCMQEFWIPGPRSLFFAFLRCTFLDHLCRYSFFIINPFLASDVCLPSWFLRSRPRYHCLLTFRTGVFIRDMPPRESFARSSSFKSLPWSFYPPFHHSSLVFELTKNTIRPHDEDIWEDLRV